LILGLNGKQEQDHWKMGLKYIKEAGKISSMDWPEEIKINHYQVEVDRAPKSGWSIDPSIDWLKK
jgi:hypothetical protein